MKALLIATKPLALRAEGHARAFEHLLTTLDALERGERKILTDEITRQLHRGLSADLLAYFESAAALWSRTDLPTA